MGPLTASGFGVLRGMAAESARPNGPGLGHSVGAEYASVELKSGENRFGGLEMAFGGLEKGQGHVFLNKFDRRILDQV